MAPGDELISDTGTPRGLYGRYPGLRQMAVKGYYYMALSGTSMATGVAAGVVAHVLEANRDENRGGPELTPNAVKAILQYTAIPLVDDDGHAYDALTQGAGGVNAKGAIELARSIDNSAPVGSYWLTRPVDSYTEIGAATHAWAQHIVWGDDIVWSDSVFNRVEAWARNIVWGNARNIVWGNAFNIVWGNLFDVVQSRASSEELTSP